MKRGRMQCKDIPNDVVIQSVADTPAEGHGSWRMWDDVLPRFERLMPGVPEPLIYAKFDKLAG